MISVLADPKKNRLYIVLDNVDRMALSAMVRDLSAACRRLVPPFTGLADLRKAGKEFFRDDNLDLIEYARHTLHAAGMERMVRVVTPDLLETAQVQDTKSADPGYEVDYAFARDRAEKMLDRGLKGVTSAETAVHKERQYYRIADPSGWSMEGRFSNFNIALRKLAAVRRAGRKNAIVIDD